MPNECVIVPTHQRQPLLYLCLEAIRAADQDIEIHVFPDRGSTGEAPICEKFGAECHLTWGHTYHGNSCNMMEALKWAYRQGYERVFVVEDDAIVAGDFFSWSRQALKGRPNAFAACGWEYSPDAPKQLDGPDLEINWYLSVAACLPEKSLAQIAQHAKTAYYSSMQQYLDAAYPQSHRKGSLHYEQDGVALRVAESMGKRCVWPRKPKAAHCGWWGYHMAGEQPRGTLEEQVAVARLIIQNPDFLALAMSGQALPEVKPCMKCQKPLPSQEKQADVVCVECFHKENPALPQTTVSHYYV